MAGRVGALRLLLDRGLPPAAAARLRAAGDDVVASSECDDLRAAGVQGLLERSAAAGRVLVSRNAGDVVPLVRRTTGPGVVTLPPERYPPTPLALDRLVRDLDALVSGGVDPEALAADVIHWLDKPAGCPFWPPG